MLRNNEPGKDLWFTPGGRVLKGECLENAVERVLFEETGLKSFDYHQVATMCHVWPEVQTVTTYYVVNVDSDDISLNDEHRDHKWITEITDELHPYLIEMIENAQLF
ncbi:MAG: NUDIX domain-containing protein [Candidatus Helarchaeota archaeon]